MSVCGLSPAHPLFLCHSLRGSHLREFLVFFSKLAKKVYVVFFTTLAFFTAGCDVENEVEDTIASGHGILQPINLHNCAAFSISHPNLSPLSLPLSASLHFLLLRIITHRIFTNWHLFVPRNIVMLQSRFRRITRSSSAPPCNPPCSLRCWQITGPAKVFLSFFLSLFYCSLTRWSSYPTLSPFEFWTPINCLHSRVSSQIGAKAKNVFDKLFGQNWQLSRRLWKMFVMNTLYL